MKKICFLLFLIFFTVAYKMFAQTVHALVVANTEDVTIGKSCDVDKIRMTAEINTIAAAIGYKTDIKQVSGNSFNFEEVKKNIESINSDENDVIFFYYSGHGYNQNDVDTFPTMHLLSGYLSLNQVKTMLSQKKQRLIIVMGDCCNIVVTDTLTENRSFVPLKIEIDKEQNYRNLFLDPRGSILVASAKKGQYAMGNDAKGGFYSNFFIVALQYAVNYSNNLSWEALLADASNRLLRIKCDQCPQYPQYTIALNANVNKNAEVKSNLTFDKINKYLNQFLDNKTKNKSTLLSEYAKYFEKNARVDIYVGNVMTDMQTIENYLDRIYCPRYELKLRTFSAFFSSSKNISCVCFYTKVKIE